jgi:hypothetical protein
MEKIPPAVGVVKLGSGEERRGGELPDADKNGFSGDAPGMAHGDTSGRIGLIFDSQNLYGPARGMRPKLARRGAPRSGYNGVDTGRPSVTQGTTWQPFFLLQ